MFVASSLIASPAFCQPAVDSSSEVFLAPLITNKSGFQTRQGQQSQSAGSEASSAIGAGSPPSALDLGSIIGATPQDLTALSACTWWWVHGTHNWRWRGIPGIIISVSLSGRSWTTYGTSTGTCGTPLVVDRLHVEARTHRTGDILAFVLKRTAFNVDTVDVSDQRTEYNVGGPCGGSAFHEAMKSGITWNTRSRSGCAP